jgi:segregation and condensation protein A
MVATIQPTTDIAGTFSGFPVRIEVFEGPLDLLLHLVRRQEVEIAEVEIAAITDEYLRYLDTMAVISIDLAGDFLVMAANLLWLKSRALLPRHEELAEEIAEEEFAQTEEALKERLEEYRSYKEAAVLLAESRDLRKRVFLRALSGEDEIGSGYVPLADVSLFDMVAAIQEMIERTKDAPVGVVRPAEITVADCIEGIVLRLQTAPERRCSFTELFDFPTTRVMIVMVFLAVLELIRRRRIRVSHGMHALEIVVGLAEA